MVDEQILALAGRGEASAATGLLVENYGAEVLGYVNSLLRDEDLAADAFAFACESAFTSILAFRGQSSVRTWFYTIARHAAFREARGQRRRRGERISKLQAELQEQLRSATAAFRKTAVKSEVVKLRESLSEDERELLLLRVDRNLSWVEIAAVRLDDPSGADDAAISREAARCRKQFERAKSKLRELAEQAGLLPAKGET